LIISGGPLDVPNRPKKVRPSAALRRRIFLHLRTSASAVEMQLLMLVLAA